MKSHTVVAAIIIHNNKILCTQRGEGNYSYLAYKYEFPGGKVEENETNEMALIREIQEELKMDIVVQKPFLTVEHHYPDFKIKLHSFFCSCKSSDLTLTEHLKAIWLDKEDLSELNWADADLPIVDALKKSLL